MRREWLIWKPGFFLFFLFLGVLASPCAAQAPEIRLSKDRAYLGLSMALADLPDGSRGIHVVEVVDRSPADRVGIRAGDMIISIDGASIEFADPIQLVLGFDRFEAGQRLKLVLLRGNVEMVREVVAERTPPESLARLQAWLDSAMVGARQGGGAVAACAGNLGGRQFFDPSSRRWAMVESCAREEGEIIFSIAREADHVEPMLFFESSDLQAVGLEWTDLAPHLQAIAQQLKPGETIRFRMAETPNGTIIESLGPLPEHIELPHSP